MYILYRSIYAAYLRSDQTTVRDSQEKKLPGKQQIINAMHNSSCNISNKGSNNYTLSSPKADDGCTDKAIRRRR